MQKLMNQIIKKIKRVNLNKRKPKEIKNQKKLLLNKTRLQQLLPTKKVILGQKYQKLINLVKIVKHLLLIINKTVTKNNKEVNLTSPLIKLIVNLKILFNLEMLFVQISITCKLIHYGIKLSLSNFQCLFIIYILQFLYL